MENWKGCVVEAEYKGRTGGGEADAGSAVASSRAGVFERVNRGVRFNLGWLRN